MNSDSKIYKEKKIMDYLSNIDKNNISINKIKNDLKNILKMTPAVEIQYLPEKMIVEGSLTVKETPVCIDIYWSDDIQNQTIENTRFYI